MTIQRWDVQDEHICEDGDFVLYADHKEELRKTFIRVRIAFDKIYGVRGVCWTDDLERILDDVLKEIP